jgi:predicted double-glycine peptidase
MVNIPIWINVLLILLFVLLGFLEYKRLISKDPTLDITTVLKKAPYLYVLIPLSLVFLIAANLNRPHLIWNLPLWLQYHYTALNWGGVLAIFAFIFSLASAISFRTHHREKWKIVVSGVLFIVAVQIVQWKHTRPIAQQLSEKLSADGVIMQTSGVSCAAAAGANILRTFGIEKTEREIAELFRTTEAGSSAAQIIYGMREIGFLCHKVEISDRDPEKLESPAMIFFDDVPAMPEAHAVAFMGLNEGKAEIWDSLGGKRSLERHQLAKRWQGRGIEFRLDRTH